VASDEQIGDTSTLDDETSLTEAKRAYSTLKKAAAGNKNAHRTARLKLKSDV
jgi:hypothetical protein